MKASKLSLVVATLIGFASLLPAAEVSQSEYIAPNTEAPRRELQTKASVQATVEKINYDTRMISLKNERGEIHEMKAGPEIARFHEIKKGDVVVVDYVASEALYVEKAAKGQKPAETSEGGAARLDTANPSAVMGDSQKISAQVVSVDQKNRTITLKGPDGKVETLNVPESVKRLHEIKKGDFIVAERSVAMAIAVRKP